jgi:hypothetical protein
MQRSTEALSGDLRERAPIARQINDSFAGLSQPNQAEQIHEGCAPRDTDAR